MDDRIETEVEQASQPMLNRDNAACACFTQNLLGQISSIKPPRRPRHAGVFVKP
jgi:hypothetical protein